MKTITSTFEWKLDKIKEIYKSAQFYLKTRLISDRFSVFDSLGVECELILEIYKTTTSMETDGIIGVWLRQIGPTGTNDQVNTKYRIYSVKNNKRLDISRSTYKLENQEKMGYATFKLGEAINSKGASLSGAVIHEGTLYLYCDVEVAFYNPIKNLQNNYMNMLEDELFTDCVIKVEEEEIKAHRSVLACNNEVFKKMFEDNGMLESQNGVVKISDTTPECFRALLDYFYTGRVNKVVLQEHTDDLFAIAHKYQVAALKYECEIFMSNLIDSNTIFKYCEIIVLYGAPNLEDACKDFVRINRKNFLNCKEWEDIQNTYPKLACKFLQFIIEDFDKTSNDVIVQNGFSQPQDKNLKVKG